MGTTPPRSGPAAPRPGGELEDLLRGVNHELRHRFAAALQPYDLSPHQARALRAVVEGDGLRLNELADRLRIAARSVTDVVDALEQRGLVERHRDPADRRATSVSATPEGLRVMAEVARVRHDDAADFFSRLTDGDQAALAALLAKLLA